MFSFFKKQKDTSQPLSIKIDVDAEENTFVTIDIDNERISSESFAKALYCINSGLLSSSFLGAMLKLKDIDKTYMLKVMDKWDEYISSTGSYKKESINSPIIKPTETFLKHAR